MTNSELELVTSRLPASSPSSLGFGHSSIRSSAAFTLLELLIVISIIIILAGLTIATMSYVQDKGKRSRAEVEIAAISAALESYKADNGVYPRDTTTDNLDARQHVNATQTIYKDASLYLFTQISGLNSSQTPIAGAKVYFSFKPQMLGGTRDASGNVNPVTFIRDPFGNSYGYSTAYQGSATTGYNPTFDLWSTAGSTNANQWIKNW
jgi:type II secretory pathway pseudopilin PulG